MDAEQTKTQARGDGAAERCRELLSLLEETRSKLRGQFIVQMFNRILPQDFTRAYIRAHYDYQLTGRYMQIVCLKCDRLTKDAGEAMALPLAQIRRMVEDKLPSVTDEFGLVIWAETLLCFLNYDDPQPLNRSWKHIMSDIRKNVPALRHFSFTIALGSVVEEPTEIIESVYVARRVLRCRNILGTNLLLDGRRVRFDPVDPRTVVTYEQGNIFDHIIELLDEKQMKRWLEEIYAQTIDKCQTNASLFPDMVEYLYSMFTLSMRRHVDSDFVMGCSLLSVLDYAAAHDIWNALEDCILTAVLVNAEKRRQSENRPIRMAKQYIVEHIDQKITLNALSKVVYLNPVYFCSLFKRETGESVQQYLHTVRIDRSKDMLRDGSMPISEIAARVGYQDVRYFSQVFKKTVGITPNEFRKRYS